MQLTMQKNNCNTHVYTNIYVYTHIYTNTHICVHLHILLHSLSTLLGTPGIPVHCSNQSLTDVAGLLSGTAEQHNSLWSSYRMVQKINNVLHAERLHAETPRVKMLPRAWRTHE